MCYVWEQRELGECTAKVERKAEIDTDAPIMMISAANGFIEQSEKYSGNNAGSSLANYTLLYEGELAYNHGYSKLRNFGSCFDLRCKKARIPFVYHAFSLKSGIPMFFAYYLNCGKFDGELKKRVSSTARMDGLLNISYEDYMSLKLDIPNELEQHKIASIVTVFDNLITLHQCKGRMQNSVFSVEKQWQKMSGCTNAWEQRKLGDVGKAQSGIGFPDCEQGGIEGIPFYKVSDMNNYGNEHEMRNANNYVSMAQCLKNGWTPITDVSVIFAKVGAAIMLNRKRLVRFAFLLDNNTMAFKFSKDWDIDFGKTLFERIDLTNLVQIGALPSYNASDIENIEISIPHIPEQQRIGVFFKRLDNLITLHQRGLITYIRRNVWQKKKHLLNYSAIILNAG